MHRVRAMRSTGIGRYNAVDEEYDELMSEPRRCGFISYFSQGYERIDSAATTASILRTHYTLLSSSSSSSLYIGLLYTPSERSETGGYTVFSFVCLSGCVCVCVCAHSVQSSTVCVPSTTHQPSPSCNPCPSPTHVPPCHLADICTL